MIDVIKNSLSVFDNSKDLFDEHDVSNAIRILRDKNDKSVPSKEWLAEYMAFDFDECTLEDGSVWGTYFGPMMSGTTKDGQTCEFPSISHITPKMLDYWISRANEAKHPILKTRYAALVWELSKQVANNSANIQMAHLFIDSIIEMAETMSHKYKTNIINKMKYATKTAISINDQQRLCRIRDVMIVFEEKIAEDGKCGLWGFSFDTLVMNKKVTFTEGQEHDIIKSLEARLDRVSNYANKQSFDPFASESAATRLAQYYRNKNQSDDVKRVLLKYGKAFENIAKDASGLLAVSWLQKVESIYRDFGLKQEADLLLNIIRDRGSDSNMDLRPISVKQEIPKAEMEKHVNAMNEGDFEEASRRIAFQYIPNKKKTAKQLRETAKKYPFQFLFPVAIQDNKGRTIAHIGSLENDFDGHVITDIAQNMQLTSVFLRNVLNHFNNKFSLSADTNVSELLKSPVFTADKSEIITKGLNAYFNDDHIVAIHLLIPQIEDAIRNLLELTGGTTFKQSRGGGYHLKTFDDLLRDESIVESLGEDAILYLRILYTDPRGWNLRNNVCHGISLSRQFCVQITDRIFHSLLLLGQIREHKEK